MISQCLSPYKEGKSMRDLMILGQMFNPFLSLSSHKRNTGSVNPDQMLQNAASDQGLHGLH